MTAEEQAALERVYADQGIPPGDAGPSAARWLVDMIEDAIDRFTGGVAGTAGVASLAWGLAALVAAVLAVLVAVATVRLVLRRVRRGAGPGQPPPEGLEPAERGRAARARTEVERALAEGRWRDAVRGAWARVAWTLHERGVGAYEEDLTNREYVEVVRARSPGWPRMAGLRAVARDVERLAYAGGEPGEAEVRRLVDETERLLEGVP